MKQVFDSDSSWGWTRGHVAPFKAGSKILRKGTPWRKPSMGARAKLAVFTGVEGTTPVTKSQLMLSKWEKQRFFGTISPEGKDLQFIEP